MESTRQAGKSYFADSVDPQELFEKYSGTGELNKTRSHSFLTENLSRALNCLEQL
jgi:hypothetical protein